MMKWIKRSVMIPEFDESEVEEDVTAGEWVKIKVKSAQMRKIVLKENFPEWAAKTLK